MLWSIIYCSSHHCLRSVTTQDWCLWVLRSAGERDRTSRLCIVWYWQIWNQILNAQDCPCKSTGNCTLVVQSGALPIEIWTDRQTGWKVRYLCQSRPEWQQPVLSNELHCVCCAQWKFTIKSADRQDKALVSGSTDESEQFGKKYLMLVQKLSQKYNWSSKCGPHRNMRDVTIFWMALGN